MRRIRSASSADGYTDVYVSVADIFQSFVGGYLNLEPAGQRPMIGFASMNLVRDMLYCNMTPNLMVYNKIKATSTFDVVDGLQRTTKILGSLMGILPVFTLDGSKVYLSHPDDESYGWRAIYNAATKPIVKESILKMLKLGDVGMDVVIDKANVARDNLRVQLLSISLSVQEMDDWPPRAAACFAQLQSMSTATYSEGEMAYMSTNNLSEILRANEPAWMRAMAKLRLIDKFDHSKMLFLHVTRGVACTLEQVEFVNKESNAVGFGGFMSAVFVFMRNKVSDFIPDFDTEIIRDTFLKRLDEFSEYYVSTPACAIRNWKPDMVAALAFMMTLGDDFFPNARVVKVLKRIERPNMNKEAGFYQWFKQCYSKKTEQNLAKNFADLLAAAHQMNETRAAAAAGSDEAEEGEIAPAPKRQRRRRAATPASSSSSDSSDSSDSDS